MNIERKNGLIPIPFLFASPRYYATFGDYNPKNDYFATLIDQIPSDWLCRRSGAWWNFAPLNNNLPDSGFKIHVSSNLESAPDVLTQVSRMAFSCGVPFKFIVDQKLHEFSNSKNYSSWSCGKFITIYPASTREFSVLIDWLRTALRDAGGPYIFSDKHAPGSSAVFYRFGAFSPHSRVNVFGEYERLVSIGEQQMADQTMPVFYLPPNIIDPVRGSHSNTGDTGKSNEELILRDRFAVTGTLHRSNSGAVLLARDNVTGEVVVLKEARRGIIASGFDATYLLAREYSVLELLRHTGVTPLPIDFFKVHDSYFIAMQHINGVPLSKFRTSPVITALHKISPSEAEIRDAEETVRKIYNNLSNAVRLIHQKGIVVGDIAPQNVMITPESLSVKILDFEAAAHVEEELDLRINTIGFRSSNTSKSFAEDQTAVRKVAASTLLPVQTGSELNPYITSNFIRRLTSDYPAFCDLGSELEPGFEFSESVCDLQSRRSILKELVRGLKESVGFAASGHLWACDYRGVKTNPLSIAFGALGVAPLLRLVEGEVPSVVQDWITEALQVDRDYAPGLWVGSAGISWGLAELGRTEEAELWFDRAIESKLKFEKLDIFFGAAGIGVTALRLFHVLKCEKYLEQAIDIADQMLQLRIGNLGTKYCSWKLENNGFGHGHAGIAYFFLALYKSTGDYSYLEFAEASFRTEVMRGYITPEGALCWLAGDHDKRGMPYFRIGGAGVGAVACRLFETTDSKFYRDACKSIALGCSIKYAAGSGLLTGLTGIGEFFLDMQKTFPDDDYQSQLKDIAKGIDMFLFESEFGLCAPSESLTRMSFDYGTGSAGIAYFFHRLQNRKAQRRLFEFD
ncbi:class III lanthionine synthetase LanKC [Henriciella marina]|uniref:class III lanthionine synthetase LanKC n=1 Tax=Henriciella marina TaxID=453851 RepID=UPI0003A75FA0|nr:class III lanthionine synthetase LanKC [Henriciella marina]